MKDDMEDVKNRYLYYFPRENFITPKQILKYLDSLQKQKQK
jgi:hypothetical protein